jgi:hypothetical protein
MHAYTEKNKASRKRYPEVPYARIAVGNPKVEDKLRRLIPKRKGWDIRVKRPVRSITTATITAIALRLAHHKLHACVAASTDFTGKSLHESCDQRKYDSQYGERQENKAPKEKHRHLKILQGHEVQITASLSKRKAHPGQG